jgi:predicted transcriptional regulator
VFHELSEAGPASERTGPASAQAVSIVWTCAFDVDSGQGVVLGDTTWYRLGMAMTLRLSEEQSDRLRATAEREHLSMQQVALKAIDEYTLGRVRRRDELLARIVAEDAGVLKRLSDA